MCNVAKHSLCGFILRFWGFLPKCGSFCVLGREWAPTRGTWKKTKSRLVTVQERRHHPYSVEWTLTLSEVTQGHRAASTASGSTFHTALEALFCWHRHSPSLSGNKGCFLQLYTLLHTFTFMLWFIDLLVMGGIRVGCTCSSALLIFFIIALDTNSALGLGREWFMWHILSSENGVYKVFFLLSSPAVASVKLSLYLRAAAVEYCCCVTHPGRWFVTGEDRKEKLLQVWARFICACSSLASKNVWDRTTWTASTADSWSLADMSGSARIAWIFYLHLGSCKCDSWVPAPHFQCQGRRYWIMFGKGG